jgi:dolichyl-phosphate-mannose--protein O-mannosyl transferase
MIQELAFLDEEKESVPVKIVESDHLEKSHLLINDFSQTDPLISSNPEFLCDEQDLIAHERTNLNGTYFDEIYHARTAYEFVHHLTVYEWTHPPLGKAMISLGILLFGMTPFGWRFTGALVGVLMIPVIYILAKKLFLKTRWAFFAAFLFTFDFMHFAQTRISTIDVYVTFFVMLMYLFMAFYLSLNIFEPGRIRKHGTLIRSLIYLFLCGLCAGLACAAKWQGVYAMLGLPVLFFYSINKRRLEFISHKCVKNVTESNIDFFPQYATITLAMCVIFFIIIPIVIYTLSYVPYLRTPGKEGIKAIIQNQKDMFGYHSDLESTHPYSSYWFQWPLMMRPIYYYAGTLANGLRTGITSFGNPAVWWTGIAAFFYCVRRQSKQFSKTVLLLFVAYGANYLPWIFIFRTTYIYHYFPSVPFVVLMVTQLFKDKFDSAELNLKDLRLPFAYLVLTLLLFIIFYPTLSATPIHMWFVNTFLKWMPSWVLSFLRPAL